MAGNSKIFVYIMILLVIVLFFYFISNFVNPFIDQSSQNVANSLTQTP